MSVASPPSREGERPRRPVASARNATTHGDHRRRRARRSLRRRAAMRPRFLLIGKHGRIGSRHDGQWNAPYDLRESGACRRCERLGLGAEPPLHGGLFNPGRRFLRENRNLPEGVAQTARHVTQCSWRVSQQQALIRPCDSALGSCDMDKTTEVPRAIMA